MTTFQEIKNERVDTVKETLVDPAGIVTLAGTDAMKGILFDKVMMAPPAGDGPFKVTVPVDGLPPVTEVGLSDREDNARLGAMVSCADLLEPL